MTTIEAPPPALPEPDPPQRRSGFYLSPWVAAVLGGLVLLAIGFVIDGLSTTATTASAAPSSGAATAEVTQGSDSSSC